MPHKDPAGIAQLLHAVLSAGAQQVDGDNEEEDVLDPVGGHLEGQEERVGHRQDARYYGTVQEEQMNPGKKRIQELQVEMLYLKNFWIRFRIRIRIH